MFYAPGCKLFYAVAQRTTVHGISINCMLCTRVHYAASDSREMPRLRQEGGAQKVQKVGCRDAFHFWGPFLCSSSPVLIQTTNLRSCEAVTAAEEAYEKQFGTHAACRMK